MHSHHREVLEGIAAACVKQKVHYIRIDGDTPQVHAQRSIHDKALRVTIFVYFAGGCMDADGAPKRRLSAYSPHPYFLSAVLRPKHACSHKRRCSHSAGDLLMPSKPTRNIGLPYSLSGQLV